MNIQYFNGRLIFENPDFTTNGIHTCGFCNTAPNFKYSRTDYVSDLQSDMVSYCPYLNNLNGHQCEVYFDKDRLGHPDINTVDFVNCSVVGNYYLTLKQLNIIAMFEDQLNSKTNPNNCNNFGTLTKQFLNYPHEVVFAIDANRIIGFMTVSRFGSKRNDYPGRDKKIGERIQFTLQGATIVCHNILINEIYVLPEYRTKGWGRRMMQKLEQSYNLSTLDQLWIEDPNSNCQQFLQKIDYKLKTRYNQYFLYQLN